VVANAESSYTFSEFRNSSCCFVTVKCWKVASPLTVNERNVTVTDCTGAYFDSDLTLSWCIDLDFFNNEGLSEFST